MPLIDVVIDPVALALLGCLEDALDAHDSPVTNISLRPGDQTELLLALGRDECCEGTAWVRTITWYPTDNFPEPLATYNRCAPRMWALVLEMGVARCAPMGTATDLPSSADWNTAVGQVNTDAAAMQCAAQCLARLDDERMVLVGQWLPTRTEGGCMGGTLPVTVSAGPCNCQQ